MGNINSSQRQHLKALAHGLDPICFVGKGGLTGAVIQSIVTAFNTNELLKVKFIDFKKEKKELSAKIEAATESNLVGIIGNIATFYREHPEKEKRRITLPE
jgi:RNA-binding protein